MKSNAPWSVKGIEKDAREAAKAAAQREGMTVGEWLNQIIYTAGDPNAAPTTGEIEGLSARDLAAAIEHLSRRIATAEARSAEAADGLTRSLGGAVERLQRLERTEPTADARLAERVKLLEEKSTDRQRIEALRALERAVGQIAVQFSNAEKSTVARLDVAERQMQAIATRIDNRPATDTDTVSAAAVRDAIEGMAERVARAEKIAAEAAAMKAEAAESVDADFIQKTGLRLRILGDEIKRGGDQIRTLETTISRLTQQIDAAEKRSAEGVQKVAETIAELRDQFSSADAVDQAGARAEIEAAVSEIAQRTEDRIESLQQSLDDMMRRLDDPASRAADAQAAPFRAAAAPTVHSDPLNDLDSELEDAFAALDLEEPAPVVAAKAASVEPSSADDEDDEDAFGFDSDRQDTPETTARDAFEADDDAADVLAEIRQAFGIVEPTDETEIDTEETAAEETALASDDDLEFDAPPPIAVAPADADEKDADYLKAARRVAREAAAKAAAEEETPKRKLTPKQRAILAARIKKRKLEAAKADAEAVLTASAAPAAPFDESETANERGARSSIRERIAALTAHIKLRAPGRKTEEPATDAFVADDGDRVEALKTEGWQSDSEEAAEKTSAPNILSSVNAAAAKLKRIPNAGGVIGLAAAIVLALFAALFMFKDILGKKPAQPGARAKAEVSAPGVVDPVAVDQIDAASATNEPLVRPRELYLDNITALRNATNDQEARAALVHIEEAAALGHPPAQLQIGELYKIGQLYDRDLGAARMWFERAANGGNLLAMHRLGVMAARGEGGPVDQAASIGWFEKAANLGQVDSQYNLGATYQPTPDGAAGGVQDRAKAYYWYSMAAKSGDAQAGELAAGMATGLSAAERSTIDAEIAAWAPHTPDVAANELPPTN